MIEIITRVIDYVPMHARYVSSLKEEYVHDIRIYSQFDNKQKASLSAIEDISTKKNKRYQFNLS